MKNCIIWFSAILFCQINNLYAQVDSSQKHEKRLAYRYGHVYSGDSVISDKIFNDSVLKNIFQADRQAAKSYKRARAWRFSATTCNATGIGFILIGFNQIIYQNSVYALPLFGIAGGFLMLGILQSVFYRISLKNAIRHYNARFNLQAPALAQDCE